MPIFDIRCFKCNRVIKTPIQLNTKNPLYCSTCVFFKLDLSKINFFKELVVLLSSKYQNVSISKLKYNIYLVTSQKNKILSIEFNTVPVEVLIPNKMTQIKNDELQFNMSVSINIEDSSIIDLIRDFKKIRFRGIILN